MTDDIISRQAAIDKAILIPIARIVTEDKVIWRKAVFVEDIEALPSAQPDWNEMIVICDCCGHTIHIKRQYGEREECDSNG